jgi:hypothetical protein
MQQFVINNDSQIEHSFLERTRLKWLPLKSLRTDGVGVQIQQDKYIISSFIAAPFRSLVSLYLQFDLHN